MENKSSKLSALVNANCLVFITPLSGTSVLGRFGLGSMAQPIDSLKGLSVIRDAILCERIRIQVAPGQFELTFLAMPLDVFDQSPKTIFVKVASYFIVEKESKLAKFYEKTLEDWQLQRAGLVQPTGQDLGNIHPPNKGNGA